MLTPASPKPRSLNIDPGLTGDLSGDGPVRRSTNDRMLHLRRRAHARKGTWDGKLHEVTALSLVAQALQAVRDRNGLDTSKVDDVVLGCVAPVGEQGSDIARIAVLNADFAETVAGVQINRFCASGLRASTWPPPR